MEAFCKHDRKLIQLETKPRTYKSTKEGLCGNNGLGGNFCDNDCQG